MIHVDISALALVISRRSRWHMLVWAAAATAVCCVRKEACGPGGASCDWASALLRSNVLCEATQTNSQIARTRMLWAEGAEGAEGAGGICPGQRRLIFSADFIAFRVWEFLSLVGNVRWIRTACLDLRILLLCQLWHAWTTLRQILQYSRYSSVLYHDDRTVGTLRYKYFSPLYTAYTTYTWYLGVSILLKTQYFDIWIWLSILHAESKKTRTTNKVHALMPFIDVPFPLFSLASFSSPFFFHIDIIFPILNWVLSFRLLPSDTLMRFIVGMASRYWYSLFFLKQLFFSFCLLFFPYVGSYYEWYDIWCRALIEFLLFCVL